MADSSSALFLATIAGAIVGGGASVGGTVLVNRQELRRRERIRLLDDYIPQLGKLQAERGDDYAAGRIEKNEYLAAGEWILSSMWIAGSLAGNRDQELVSRIMVTWKEHRSKESHADPTEYASIEARVSEGTDRLVDYLIPKIRGGAKVRPV
jgi:hypothetical protein